MIQIAASPKLSPKAGTSYGESLPSHDISIQLRNHIRAAGPRSKKNRKPNNFGLNSDSMVYTNASFTTNEYEPDDYKMYAFLFNSFWPLLMWGSII